MGSGVTIILASAASIVLGFWLGGLWILILPGVIVIGMCCAALLNWRFSGTKAHRRLRVQLDFEATLPMGKTSVRYATPSFPPIDERNLDGDPAFVNQMQRQTPFLPRELRIERPHELQPSAVRKTPSVATSVPPRYSPGQPVSLSDARILAKTTNSVTLPIPAKKVSPVAAPAPQSSSTEKSPIRQRRLPKKVVSPEHYRRHERTPGYLYIARNTHHREGLYKMGYTTLETPAKRIASLNEQHRSTSDVGEFQHVFAVPTAACYMTEQALFDFLPVFRVAEKREFFYGPLNHFIEAMKAAASLSSGDASALNALYANGEEENFGVQPFPEDLRTSLCPDRPDGGGWIFVCRNKWHQEGILQLGFTTVSPYKKRDTLNAIQKELTCRIGFYEIALCVAVHSVPAVKRKLLPKINRYQVVPNGSFYQIPMTLLKCEIENTIPVTTSTRTSKYKSPKARKGWLHCPDCLSSFPTQTEVVPICPECGWTSPTD